MEVRFNISHGVLFILLSAIHNLQKMKLELYLQVSALTVETKLKGACVTYTTGNQKVWIHRIAAASFPINLNQSETLVNADHILKSSTIDSR